MKISLGGRITNAVVSAALTRYLKGKDMNVEISNLDIEDEGGRVKIAINGTIDLPNQLAIDYIRSLM